MADDSEEKPSASHDFASTKIAIFDTFNKLKKWREEQLEEFRNRQYLESQKLLQLSGESQKQFEQLLENAAKGSDPEEKPKGDVPNISDVSSISLPNDLENHDVLEESSITGHLQRCFDDSSRSNISFSENKILSVPEKIPVFSELQNAQFSEKNLSEKEDQSVKDGITNGSVKPKRPFLKKGTGLLRYMPKSAVSSQNPRRTVPSKPNKPLVTNAKLPQRTLKLKPAIRKADAPSEHAKHIRFAVPDSNNDMGAGDIPETNLLPFSRLTESTEINFDQRNKSSSSNFSPEELRSESGTSRLEDTSISESESLNVSKENKELEEFEMLESCAQNSSFNSDSSVVQRVLSGESIKPSYTRQEFSSKLPYEDNVASSYKEILKSPSENSNFSKNIGLSKCLEEVQSRKQMLQKTISDINPRIQSLEKAISKSKKQALDDSDVSERCSTPIEDLSSEDRNVPECVNLDSSPLTNFPRASAGSIDESVCQPDCSCCDADDVLKNLYPNQGNTQNNYNEEKDLMHDVPDVQCENNSTGKSKIHEKLLELEKEIEIYQKLNERTSSLCKERDEIVRKLQKERDDFNKYKEAEKKKLEVEIQEERRQIKRQKETFMRYQKLRKDNPTKKEREELNSLRQEIQKLQEELTRQKMKYTRDSRRWKNRIDTAERERDSYQMENTRLEDQNNDLLAALKSRMKKKSEMKSLDDDETDVHESRKDIPVTKDAECQTESKELDSIISKNSSQSTPISIDTKKAKSKVRFTLAAESAKNNLEIFNEETVDHTAFSKDNISVSTVDDNMVPVSNRQENVKKDIADVNLSVISVSVEAEFKELNHGNRIERIYASGEREIIFKSGTRKVISADGKSTKFLFYNGDIKEIFPDKRETYRYVNGVIETQFPDGLKVTEFPNGQTQRYYPDGRKELKFSDNTVHYINPDGSEEIHSADGNIVSLDADGTKTIKFANGQTEIRTATYKRREFPDGSIKIVYNDGKQETRYPNGRIRIKDKDGKICLDTKYISIQKG